MSTKKRIRKLFTFNVLVVGASGLGKTTFVKTLMSDTGFKFESPLKQTTGPTLSIEAYTSEIEIFDRKAIMTIIDTPGFGDRLDNSQICLDVLQYVEDKFRDYFNEENKIQRNPKYLDPRVHVSLYFLDPSGQNLTEMDIEFMRTLGRSTNIIPIIGRADSLSEHEIKSFKKSLYDQIASNNLQIYNFPIFSDDEAEFQEKNNVLEDMLPFAIVGSEEMHELNGKKVRGRRYPWGLVEVENPEHCDFLTVKDVILNTHMEPLKEDTHSIHYEFFRKTDLIRLEKEKNKDQGEMMHKDIMSLKDAEEKEMKARKRRSRTSKDIVALGTPNFDFSHA